MQILIHACPGRMWYVDGFLAPELRRQGAEQVEIWNDTGKKGNLRACMEAFAARTGSGGTWHLQDDILLCRDFVQRAREHDYGVVYGFCCEAFTDDPAACGEVSAEKAWHSFQCVRIPNDWARGCADWFFEGAARDHPEYPRWVESGNMDDSAFRAYLLSEHRGDIVENLAPNLVEHVDWIIGGSVLHPWRGFLARSAHWEDEALVQELKKAVKGKVQYVT